MDNNEYYKKSREIIIDDVIDSVVASNIISRLRYLSTQDSNSPIELIINSPGGSVTDMFAIIDFMTNRIPNKIIGVACGVAASAATIIFISTDHRIVTKHTHVMLHDMSIQYMGSHNKVDSTIKSLSESMDWIKEIVSNKTKITSKHMKEIIAQDYFFNAEECIKYGIADEIA